MDVFYQETNSIEDVLDFVDILNEKFNLDKSEIKKLKNDIADWCRKNKYKKYRVDIGENSIVVRCMIYNGSDIPVSVHSIRYRIFKNSIGQYEILFNSAEETEYRRR